MSLIRVLSALSECQIAVVKSLSRHVPQQYDGPALQVPAGRRLSGATRAQSSSRGASETLAVCARRRPISAKLQLSGYDNNFQANRLISAAITKIEIPRSEAQSAVSMQVSQRA
jgi:hypothetical protein